MTVILVLLAALIATGVCAYHQTRLIVGAVVTLVITLVTGALLGAPVTTVIFCIIELLIAWPLLLLTFRRRWITGPLLKIFSKVAPRLSETEQIAMEAGTIGFEGELFSGKPDWHLLLGQVRPELSAEEKAFISGPVEALCAMVDDWQITHELADLPPEVWEFIKKNKFFGMIIPKQYGGLAFSALAHSAVLQKLATISSTLASTVAVPNSLGPAELLLHYGSTEQKNYYLPRLAVGEEIPCFALTSTYGGSDATSMFDYGIVCKDVVDGVETLGVKLTFDKRYITLAPIATVVGLAFRMYDPEHFLGDREDLGITLALLPRTTPGLRIGRRHFPLNIPFQNGPVQGRDVFAPLSVLIGGTDKIGHGWRMLVECLSVGRAISLPSSAAGGMCVSALACGAYARMRKQFGLAIAHFEGVEEALGRIGGITYAAVALAHATAAAVDRGEKPAISSAIAKYHATEWSRVVAADTMDIHAGKAVQLGPKNYAGRGWCSAPIGITVEGANIMTRNLMIFGQGAIRCHPYALKEMEILSIVDDEQRLCAFDKIVFEHMGFALSNVARSLIMGLSGGRMGASAGDAFTRRYYRKLNRYSAALALCTDVFMAVLGSKLKFRERLSARLGDVLSYLYIASAMLKYYEDSQCPEIDRPLIAWGVHECIWKIQQAFSGAISNFPLRSVAWLLRFLVFPLGCREVPPSDRLSHRVAGLLTMPNEARDRLGAWVYLTPSENNTVGKMNALLPEVIAAEPVERKFLKALKTDQFKTYEYEEQLAEAQEMGIISQTESDLLRRLRAGVFEFISVDDFDPSQLRAAMTGADAKKPNHANWKI